MIAAEAMQDPTPDVARITEAVLEARLVGWAKEYGGGRYVTLGWSTGEHILARLVTFGGFLPGSSAPRSCAAMTEADQVEQAVKRLAKGWPAHARVLRLDYFSPGMAMENRLNFLRRYGHKMSRAGYYNKLESAKLYIAGSL
jgi:hypothetical protein